MQISNRLLKIERRYLLMLIFGAALVFRVGAVIFMNGNAPPRGPGDEVSYDHYAERIVAGDWLWKPVSFREVGYPLVLSLAYRIPKYRYLAARLENAILGALTCVLIFVLAERVFGSKVALFSAVWSSLYFHFIYYVPFMLRETLVTLLMTVLLILLLRASSKRGWKYPALASIALVVLIHVDARYLFYVPFVGVYLVLAAGAWKVGIQKFGVFLVVFTLAMVPWQYRNYRAYDQLVLVNTRTLVLRAPWGGPAEPKSSEVRGNDRPQKEGTRQLRRVRRMVYDFTELYRIFRFRGEVRAGSRAWEKPWSLLHNASSIMMYGVLVPFFVMGYVLIVRRRWKEAYLFVVPLVAQTLLHLVKWGRERYRVPIEPVLIIVGFYGATEFYRWVRTKRRRPDHVP